jgi:hypothetical protein
MSEAPFPACALRAFRERAPDKLVDIIESRTLDGRTQELIYRPTLHN